MILNFPHPCPAYLRGCAVVIGNFDGVHLGHQALIGEAQKTGLRLVALSFSPHPREFFSGQPIFTLTPQKHSMLESYGVDALAVCAFNTEFSALSPQEFIDKILVNWLGAKAVFTGVGFKFGAKRAGDTELLSQQHFQFQAVQPVLYAEEIISSSRIREALKAGNLSLANALLGRVFNVSGEVIHGRKEGRVLGYPTANIALPSQTTLKYGIYAVRVGTYEGIASYGVRPMFDNAHPLLEVHLFDFEGDLYGKILEVGFVAYLRGEEKFTSLEGLITQMERDCLEARRLLKA